MSDNPLDFLNIRRRKQIIALGIYGVIQVIFTLSSEAKPYSWLSPIFFVVMGIYIIKTHGSLYGEYSLGNIEGLKEFHADKELEMEKTSDEEHRKFLIKLCDEIQSRITSFERLYDKFKKL